MSIETKNEQLSFLKDEVNQHLIYLVNKYQRAKSRAGTASTKNRSSVRGGGAKPYRQKGTGNARRGTNRSPLRRGGGVIFGPSPRSFAISLNQESVKIGILHALSANKDKIQIMKLTKAEKKAKDWRKFFSDKTKKVLVIADEYNTSLSALINFSNVEINLVSDLSVEWLCKSNTIYVLDSAREKLEEQYNV